MKQNQKFRSVFAINIKGPTRPLVFLSEDGKHFAALDKRIAAQLVPDYKSLNEKAQQKRLSIALQKLDHVGSVRIDSRIAPAGKKVRGKFGERRSATVEELHRGAMALLSLTDLFDSPRSGCLLLSSALAGLRLSSLQAVEPGLRSILEIKSQDTQLMQIIRELASAFVQKRKKQSGNSICKRITVDCSDNDSPFDGPTSACTFKVHKRGLKGIQGDLPLIDGLLVLENKHASRKLIESAAASTAWSIGFATSCDCAVPLPKSEFRAWNPDIVEHLLAEKPFIGALLRHWWEDADNTWAKRIIGLSDADAHSDGRFIKLNKVDPDYILRLWGYSALSFLDYLNNNGILTADETAPFRTAFEAVFFPAPPAEEAVQQDALSPDVFLDAVRLMVEEKSERIVEIGAEKATSRSRVLGGWRTINKDVWLVLLEEEFTKIYPTYAKRLGADMSSLHDRSWPLDLQKRLCDVGIIKKPSAGYRYRYDLVGKGREGTHVLAVRAELIDGKMAGKGRDIPLPPDLPDSEDIERPETVAAQGGDGL